MKLCLLTPTGDRPEAFKLCQQWIVGQSFIWNLSPREEAKIKWIVVDDGQTPVKFSENWQQDFYTIIRPEKLWEPGQNTQVSNLRLGLQHVGDADLIVFWEDDDCYLSHYLETAVAAFEADPKLLVWGERPTSYYNVAHRKFRRLDNQRYAILAATVIRRAAIPVFLSALDYPNKKGIDSNFWYRVREGELRNKCLLQRVGYAEYKAGVVGIKGMPGRPGIGRSFHEADKSKHWRKDPELKILTKLVGPERAAIYAEFYDPTA